MDFLLTLLPSTHKWAKEAPACEYVEQLILLLFICAICLTIIAIISYLLDNDGWTLSIRLPAPILLTDGGCPVQGHVSGWESRSLPSQGERKQTAASALPSRCRLGIVQKAF